MSSTPLVFKIVNPIMKTFLRSPFHSPISNRIMIISFKGRLSGKQFSTPVSYYQEGNKVVCFTHAKWWKNIEPTSKVKLRIRGQDYEGYGKAIPDDTNLMTQSLYKLLKAVPSDAAFYSVKLNEEKEPIMADVEKAVMDAVMIQIEIIAENNR